GRPPPRRISPGVRPARDLRPRPGRGRLVFPHPSCYRAGPVWYTSGPEPSGERSMQVVILCGGQGTRIRDVADDVPKPMIPIGGRPILWHIMKGFAHHGLSEFVVCLGYKSWVIKRYFLDYHLAGTDFTVRLGALASVSLQGPVPRENWQVTL